MDERFEYRGDPSLRDSITEALGRVIDPEMAIGIVELGLVYRVEASRERVHLDITMTSAACPVTELIVDDITAGLEMRSA